MAFKIYPFEPDLAVNPKTKRMDFMYRPYIQIRLQYKKAITSNFIRALVDSGSDYNIFPSSFAKEIGIDYRKGIPHKASSGIGGISIYTYGAIASINTGIKTFDTVIFFADEVRVPILGRHGFFNFFKNIEFNTKGKKMLIKY